MTKEEFDTLILELKALDLRNAEIHSYVTAESIKLIPLYYKYKDKELTKEDLDRIKRSSCIDLLESVLNITLECSENWGCGGYDEWSYFMPREFLFSQDYRDQLRIQYENNLAKKEKEKLLKALEDKKRIEEKEIARYLELKEKYEGTQG